MSTQTSTDPDVLAAAGRMLYAEQRYAEATVSFERALKARPRDADLTYALAASLRATNVHENFARARQVLAELVDHHPEHRQALRLAAELHSASSIYDRAVELWQRVVRESEDAEAYHLLSEALAELDRPAEAMEALRSAARLDPSRYGASLREIDGSAPAHHIRRARYPDTAQLNGDLKAAILEHVLGDLDVAPFITAQTSFFTMGSCFARNIADALAALGYDISYMPMSDEINTSFANRYFMDWLADEIADSDVAARMASLLPENWTRAEINARLAQADVFILTLGVGAAFFDRETGRFVMPRPTSLNRRALAERYEFRTIPVSENVENVSYVLECVWRRNPAAKIVLTVSPVPMQVTFESKSAVLADCVSKSTMRVTAHEVLQRYARTKPVYYFPSFEVFRWLGGHLERAVYGTDDGSSLHVSEDVVRTVVECFIEKLADPRSKAVPSAGAMPGPEFALRPLLTPDMLTREKPTFIYGSARMGQALHAAMGDPATWNFRGFVDSYRSGDVAGLPVLDLDQFKEVYAPGDQVVVASGAVYDIARSLAANGIEDAWDANPWWKARALSGSD